MVLVQISIYFALLLPIAAAALPADLGGDDSVATRIRELNRNHPSPLSLEESQTLAQYIQSIAPKITVGIKENNRHAMTLLDAHSHLYLKAKRTIELPRNQGFLHEFPGGLWSLGDKGDTLVFGAQLATFLRPRGPGRFLAVFSHGNSSVLSASGYRDSHQYAPITPLELAQTLELQGVQFKEYDAVLLGGCSVGGDAGKRRNTAEELSLATELPVYGATSLNASLIDILEYPSQIEGAATLTILIKVFQLPGLDSDQFVENSWRVFLPKSHPFLEAHQIALDALNMKGMPVMKPGGIAFKTTFFTPIYHFAADVAPELKTRLIKSCAQTVTELFIPEFPLQYFPGLGQNPTP